MVDQEFGYWAMATVCLASGVLGALWARRGFGNGKGAIGLGLLAASVLFLASATLLAASHGVEGLIPLGLSVGALVAFMLWEIPQPAWRGSQFRDIQSTYQPEA